MRPSILAGVVVLALAAAGCSGPAADAGAAAPDAPGAEVRTLTGAHTRFVWVQQDGKDPDAVGDQLILMGFDSHDGRGERVIAPRRASYVKPLLTPSGTRVVYSTRPKPGPAEAFVVNWDGTGLRKLGEGFALSLWKHPTDGSEWAYVGTGISNWEFATISRFPIDAPEKREVVWNAAPVSIDSFQVSPDGRLAGGLFPWPDAGIADLQARTVKKLGQGCWPSLTSARGPLFWYFDGAHRNLTMVDVSTGARWMVNINNAPGFDGAEVNHPRWTNHPRFLTISGPYNLGGPNQARAGGPQTEVYLGRFSEDFARIDGWARVTSNAGGDSLPDAWIDVARSPHATRPRGPIGPADAAATAGAGNAGSARAARLVVNVRSVRSATIPAPQSILPYRHALAVNEYEVMDVVQGTYKEKEIRIAQWAIRDSRLVAGARKLPGTAFTLVVEPYHAHPELEGERVISASEKSPLPLYYDVTPISR